MPGLVAPAILTIVLSACGSDAPPPKAASPSPAASTPTATATETAGQTEAPSEEPDAAPDVPPLDEVAVRLEPVAQAQAPTALVARPGSDDLFVAERAGIVRILRDGEILDEAVLDISGEVSTGGERGLLGLAFSADGETLFVSYTNPAGDSRVDAFAMDGDVARPDSGRNLLGVEQPFSNHNGGNIVLGPDEMLYLGLGDGGSAGDPERNAQDPSTLLGKLVRITPSNGQAPADNPFVGEDEYDPRIYALGLRNPWRFSFDRANGDLWVGDVGQDSVEEVNLTRAGNTAGRNYGWDIFEGTEPFEGDEQPPNAVIPVEEYPTGEQGCAVTGGFVYRGSDIPELEGAYLYSDFCSGFLRGLRVRNGEVSDTADLGSAEQVASFGEDGDGELYVLSLGGQISRIVAD